MNGMWQKREMEREAAAPAAAPATELVWRQVRVDFGGGDLCAT